MKKIIHNNAQKVTVPANAPTIPITVRDVHSFGEPLKERLIQPGMELWISRDRRLFGASEPLSEGAMMLICKTIGLDYEDVDYEKTAGGPFDDDMHLLFKPTALYQMLAGNTGGADYWWENVDGFLLYVNHGVQVADKPYYKYDDMKAALNLVLNHAKEKLSLAFSTDGYSDEDILKIWEESLAVKVMYSTTPLGRDVPFHGIEQKRSMGFAQIKRGGAAISDFALNLLGPGSALIVQWIDLNTDTLHKTIYVAKL